MADANLLSFRPVNFAPFIFSLLMLSSAFRYLLARVDESPLWGGWLAWLGVLGALFSRPQWPAERRKWSAYRVPALITHPCIARFCSMVARVTIPWELLYFASVPSSCVSTAWMQDQYDVSIIRGFASTVASKTEIYQHSLNVKSRFVSKCSSKSG